MDNFKTKYASDIQSKQQAFAIMLAHFLIQIDEMGYQVTLGDAYRDPRVHGRQGEKASYSAGSSAHKWRMAIDLNLFKAGQLLTRSEDYELIGTVWEKMGGSWGGRFSDGNHFSLMHNGIR